MLIFSKMFLMRKTVVLFCYLVLHMLQAAAGERVSLHVAFKEDAGAKLAPGTVAQFPEIVALTERWGITFQPAVDWPESVYSSMAERAIQNTGTDASVQKIRRIWKVTVPDSVNAVRIIEQLSATGLFEYVEQEQLMPEPPADIPPVTPSYYPMQHYLRADSGVNIEYAWSKGIFGQGIQVFDIEYGVNRAHEKLEDQPVSIMSGMTIHSNVSAAYAEHGTAAVSVVCSDKLEYGNVGMMHGITSMMLVPEYTEERGYDRVFAVSKALQQATAGDIVMYEMQAGIDNGSEYVPADYNTTIWNLTKAAVDAGIVIIAAAGNGGVNLDDDSRLGSYRSRGDNGSIIVGAGSSDGNNNRLTFSTYGARVNVQAWGTSVISAGYGNYARIGGDFNQNYTMFSGTSSATPIVASAAIAIQSYYHDRTGAYLDGRQMREILMATGKPQGDPQNGHIGPLPNVKTAFDYVDSLVESGMDIGKVPEHHAIHVFPNPASSAIYLELPVGSAAKHTYIFDAAGRVVYLSDKWQDQVDVSGLPGGYYTIVVLGKDNQVFRSGVSVVK